MKKIFCFFIFFTLTSVSMFAKDNSFTIVASVNSKIIFYNDILTRIKILKALDPSFDVTSEAVKETTLKQLVDEEIILENSKTFNISANSSEVIGEIQNLEKNMKIPEGSLEKKALAGGVSKKSFYSYFKNQVTIHKFIQGIGYNFSSVSTSEVETEYLRTLNLNGKNQYLVSEIIVPFVASTRATAEKEINNIYKRLKSGTNFETLMASGTYNKFKIDGGKNIWIQETQISDSDKELLEGMSLNSFTPPLVNDNSYYILFLKDKRPILYIDPNNPQHTAQLKQFIKMKIQNEKSQLAVNDYIRGLYNKTAIKFYELP